MKTKIFFKTLSSEKLNETFSKQFGGKVKLEQYSREQLEDMRNKLRTKIFQQEGGSGYNDLLTNETYQKDKAMLQLLNTRIKEMLGEDIKKLMNKLDQINEGKSKKGDGNLANNYPPYDKVTRGDVIAGATGKDQKGGKVKEEEMKVGDTKKTGTGTITKTEKGVIHQRHYGSDEPHVEPVQKKDKSSMTGAERRAQKDADKKQAAAGKDWEKRFPGSVTKVKGKAASGSKEVDESMEKCNHTAEGQDCPVHGMKECGTMEAAERKAKVKPSTGMSAKEKSAAVKKAKSGKDMGKPGKTFKDIEQAAGGGEKGKKIAGSVFWKGQAKKAAKKESIENFRANVRFVNESLDRFIAENEEEKAKTITAASDIVNDFTSWMQRVGQYQTKAIIELADDIRADFGIQQAEAFKQAVGPALAATLDVLTQQRESISNAVAALAGEEVAPADQMGMEPEMGPPDEVAGETEPDQMNAGDEFAASDAAAGGEETSGREMRESKFAKKLAESHSILSKLAR